MSSQRSDEKSGRILHQAMISVLPQLARARVDYYWGGLVDMSLDRMVYAGEHDGLDYSSATPGTACKWRHMGRQMAKYMNGAKDANPGATSPSSGSPATSVRSGSCGSQVRTTSSWTSSSSG
jgi:hypothetical protein